MDLILTVAFVLFLLWLFVEFCIVIFKDNDDDYHYCTTGKKVSWRKSICPYCNPSRGRTYNTWL